MKVFDVTFGGSVFNTVSVFATDTASASTIAVDAIRRLIVTAADEVPKPILLPDVSEITRIVLFRDNVAS
jgi:hypothetical protein